MIYYFSLLILNHFLIVSSHILMNRFCFVSSNNLLIFHYTNVISHLLVQVHVKEDLYQHHPN